MLMPARGPGSARGAVGWLRRHAWLVALLDVLVLTAAAPLSRVAGLPDLLEEVAGDGVAKQAIGQPWRTESVVSFVARAPVRIVEVRVGAIDPALRLGEPVLLPASENGQVTTGGFCGQPVRAGWFTRRAAGTVLTEGETYGLAIPMRPRGGDVLRASATIADVTVIVALDGRSGDQTFARRVTLQPPTGGRTYRCTHERRAHWIYEELSPPLTQPRVHGLWDFVERYLFECPGVLTSAAEDPAGRMLLRRIRERAC